jgi:hypothetical protein
MTTQFTCTGADGTFITYSTADADGRYNVPFTLIPNTAANLNVYLWDATDQEYDLIQQDDANNPWIYDPANNRVDFDGAGPAVGTATLPDGSTQGTLMLARVTDVSEDELAQFTPGSSIRSQDLNDNFNKLGNAIEELHCNATLNGEDFESFYWNKVDVDAGGDTYTSSSTSAWPSNNTTIPTTAAGDERWLNATGGDIKGGDGISTDESGGAVTIAVDLDTNSGLEFDSGKLQVDDGNGIVVNATGVNVGQGTGITVNTDNVAVNQVTIWGQNHNHSGNVSGDISFVDNITFNSGSGRTIQTGSNDDNLTIAGATASTSGALIVNRDLELATNATIGLGGVTYDPPSADGSANEVLTTDGSGNLSWTDKTTDTNTTYDLTVPASTTDIRLAGSNGNNDDITITGGNNVTVTRTSATELDIAATDTNTTYTLPVTASSGNAVLTLTGANPASTDPVTIRAGNNVSFTGIDAAGFTINSSGGGGGGGNGAEVVANCAGLNTAVTDGPPSDGDLYLVIDSSNMTAAAGTAPGNTTAINDLPETVAAGAPVGGYGGQIQVTVEWDSGNTRWQYIRWAVQEPDNRYVLEQGDTMTGNLLFNNGSDDTITLATNGSASFAGDVIVGPDNAVKIGSAGRVDVSRADGISTAFSVTNKETDPDEETVTILANGSASFSGGNCEISSDGLLRVKRSAANGSGGLVVYPDNNFSVAATASINTDGSASFAAAVSSGKWGIDDTATRIENGIVTTIHNDTDQYAFRSYYNGYNPTNATAEIKVDGSARFAGSVDLSGITSDNSIVVNRTGTSQTAYQANLNGVKKAEIKAGGAAEFAGTLTTGGTINAANTSAAGNGLIVGNSNQIVLQADGSSSFAGIATYGPLSFDGSQHYLSIGAGDLTVGSKTDYSLVYYNSANTVKYGFKEDGSAEFAGNVDAASFTVNGSALPTGYDFPSGTVMLFYQANAPTGFTKITTQNNKALRVVSGTGGGTGGSVDFTTAFSDKSGSLSGATVGATTLTTTQMPSHAHTINARTETSSGVTDAVAYTTKGGGIYSPTTAGAGSSGSHTHSITGGSVNFDIEVEYIDVIIASRN